MARNETAPGGAEYGVITAAIEGRLAGNPLRRERRILKRIQVLAGCVSRFHLGCEACRDALTILGHLAAEGPEAVPPDERAMMIRNTARHLRSSHHLLPCGTRALLGTAVGGLAGILAALAFASIPTSLSPFTITGLALSLGLLTGLLLDLEARRDGQVL